MTPILQTEQMLSPKMRQKNDFEVRIQHLFCALFGSQSKH